MPKYSKITYFSFANERFAPAASKIPQIRQQVKQKNSLNFPS